MKVFTVEHLPLGNILYSLLHLLLASSKSETLDNLSFTIPYISRCIICGKFEAVCLGIGSKTFILQLPKTLKEIEELPS